MKIYLIYGEQDAGKTTACRKLYNCIISLGGVLKFYDTFKWENDFKCVTEFDGKRLGVYSPGDERGHLSDAIAFGNENNCDVLVAAVRKRIAYNAPLQEMGDTNSDKWLTLDKGVTEDERRWNVNRIVIALLNKIYQA